MIHIFIPSLQKLLPNHRVKRGVFKDYTYKVTINDNTYHILYLGVSKSNLVTINSKYIWDIKSGVAEGINFKTTSTRRIDLTTFQKHPNKIIVLKTHPYKILKYINESEVVPLGDESNVYGIDIHYSMDSLVHKLQKK